MTKTPTLLIDGDILLHKTCCVTMTDYKFEDSPWSTYYSNEEETLDLIKKRIGYLKKRFKTESIIFTLSDKLNFRKEVYKSYKSNRKDTMKPLGFSRIRDELLTFNNTMVKPTLEADDLMAILATLPKAKRPYEGEPIIVSIDKDLLQVACKVYNSDKDEIVHPSKLEGNMQFWTQCLTGDKTDGYSCITGLGPKTAEKLLAGVTTKAEAFRVIKKAYEKAGHPDSYLTSMVRCAKILQSQDYDWATNEIKLFEVP